MIQAVLDFGLTERQARFMVTVMLNGGVCVPRQYAQSVGTAYGQNVNVFFDKLVKKEFAVRCSCVHNRGAVYQLGFQPLYRAIGEADSSNRKPIAAGRVVERLMLIDAVISQPELIWLAPTFADVKERFERVVRDELASPLSPRIFEELRWYFEERRRQTAHEKTEADRFQRAGRAFAGIRWRLLYRRWQTDGDSALEVATSTAIRDALACGQGVIESEVLSHSYRHLSPLASLVRARLKGVEKGERALGDSQPPPAERAASFAAH